jgi:hypothetical protein
LELKGPEEAKNLAGRCPSPDSDPFKDAKSAENLVRLSNKIAGSENPKIRVAANWQIFQTYNETFSIS